VILTLSGSTLLKGVLVLRSAFASFPRVPLLPISDLGFAVAVEVVKAVPFSVVRRLFVALTPAFWNPAKTWAFASRVGGFPFTERTSAPASKSKSESKSRLELELELELEPELELELELELDEDEEDEEDEDDEDDDDDDEEELESSEEWLAVLPFRPRECV
jgi:hypothetical protein